MYQCYPASVCACLFFMSLIYSSANNSLFFTSLNSKFITKYNNVQTKDDRIHKYKAQIENLKQAQKNTSSYLNGI